MFISTKGRYALRIMIDLAKQENGRFIPLKEVALRQELSEKYLESILSILSKAGYLSSLRGKGGGYRLSRSPHEYTVAEILQLTEGSLAPVSCLECNSTPCRRAAECPTLPMWQQLQTLIHNFFENITLEDLTNTPGSVNFVI